MAERRFGVGYALAPKKQRSFIQDTLVSLARSRGIDLIPVDSGTPLADQGPFDVVIHKLYGDDWRRQLSEFSARNPRSVVIDQPEAIERLHNRISMLSVVTELDVAEPGPAADDHRSETVGIPKQKVIYDKESLLDRPALEGRLKFPVVAKPLVADGSAMSHMMNLVFKQEGLHALEPPVVLQEFINHGGLIFKVYVAGDHVQCVKRISLPDVTEEGPATERQLLSFSQVSNLAKNERADDKYYKKMRLDEAEMPPEGFLADISRRLRRALGLHLFNFDVIRDSSNGNRYLIIDINYFPGYAKMPGYEKLLTDFFCDLRTKLLGPAEAKEGDSRCGDGDDGVLPEEPRSRDDKNR